MCNGWNQPNLDPSPSTNTNIIASSVGKDEFLIDAGYTAHPSALKIPDDVLKLRKPLSIANGTEDIQLKPPQLDEISKLFEENNGKDPECQIKVYEGAKHGFAVRWDPKDEREQKQGEESEDQAVRWFRKHLLGEKTSED